MSNEEQKKDVEVIDVDYRKLQAEKSGIIVESGKCYEINIKRPLFTFSK